MGKMVREHFGSIKFDRCWHFYGDASLPPEFKDYENRTREPPYFATLEDIERWSKTLSVMIYSVDEQLVIAFDIKGKRFQQR